MKKNLAVALAVVGVTAWGGVGLAAGKSPAIAKSPEPNTWESSLAPETGSLPANDAKVDTAKGRTSSAPVPVIEVGGVVYRVGVDTP